MFKKLVETGLKLSITLSSVWIGTASYSIIQNKLYEKNILKTHLTLGEIGLSGIIGGAAGLYFCTLVIKNVNDPSFICNINITSN